MATVPEINESPPKGSAEAPHSPSEKVVLSDALLAAETTEQVSAAFEKYAQPHAGEFVPRLASDILALIHDPHFPSDPKRRLAFLRIRSRGDRTLSFVRPAISFEKNSTLSARAATKAQRAITRVQSVAQQFPYRWKAC
jgi:hypothetical protein